MDVVTFGETMVCFTGTRPGTVESSLLFEKHIAGAESNVAIGLSRLGFQVRFISRLGNDGFGRFIYKTLRGEGLDVSCVTFDSDNSTGLYFKERLGAGRTNVHYYRKQSAASHLSAADLTKTALAGAKYLFITGITAAISDTCREAIFSGIEVAHELGMKVVFDPNIRLKLWSPDDARATLLDIARCCDVVIPGLDEGKLLTGQGTAPDVASELLTGMTELVILKLGAAGAYYRSVDNEGYVVGYEVEQVDEIGAGDAFAAGFLSGVLDGLGVEEAVDRACAMGALAVTAVGDYEALPSRVELESFLNGASIITR